MCDNNVDIQENGILDLSPEVLEILLIDHTKNQHSEISEKNIIWATDMYEAEHGSKDYSFFAPIKPELITGENGNVIRPRVAKSIEEQKLRIKQKAEVFTPTWVCNAQNNLIDEQWFGRKNVFNTENSDHTWTPNSEKITFPEGKTWKNYVSDVRLEITCGEAPYLVSRYDTTTGEPLVIENRIGLLDRKLRVVSENTQLTGEWLKYAYSALKSVYGYEWQGDSLLIARENALYTFIDYHKQKFGTEPLLKSIKYATYIISWNLWQMDGLKFVVPESCKSAAVPMQLSMFGQVAVQRKMCLGCLKNSYTGHSGIKCLVRDWKKPKDRQITEFCKLLK